MSERFAAPEPVLAFTAGWISGIAGIVAGHPLDTLRVRLQVSPHSNSATNTNATAAGGLAPSARKTWSNISSVEGWKAFFRGMLSSMSGLALQNAMLLLTYDEIRRWQEQRHLENPKSFFDVWLAGTISGAFQTVITTPVDGVKIKLQVAPSPDRPAYTGSFDCARGLIRRHGLRRGLFHGFAITSLRDASSYGVYFLAYEYTKAKMEEHSLATGAIRAFAGGGLGGILSWAFCYPFDIIKTNIQQSPVDRSPKIVNVAREIYKKRGLMGFTRGLSTTLVRAFVVNGTIFSVYEMAKVAFNLKG